ncbi:MAG: hypothetical protein GYB42_10310 [Alphaproteobacteria bacterium]|nr:hypothetical protein [Alphaproteobacteria bacterium]
MRAALFVTLAVLAGCSSSFGRIQAVREAAPEWYQARKVELRGEGYPRIAEIPNAVDISVSTERLSMSEAEVSAAFALFQSDPRALSAEESAADMLAWATDTRRAVEGQIPAPDFMTDEEVRELKARFDRPRGRL